MIYLLFISLLVLIFIGVPVVFSIGISAAFIMLIDDTLSFILIPSKFFAGMDSFPLLAIPFFVIAGEVMNKIGLTNKLVAFSKSLVGNIRGGLAHVNIVASMFFAGVSGSCVADSAAVGSVLIPSMIKNDYDKDFSVVVTATSSTIGPIIPPSILMVLYGFLANVSIGQLFLGGFIPGIFIGLSLMIISYYFCVKRGYDEKGSKFSLEEVYDNFKKSIWALFVPIIIVGGIVSGVFTATESGVIAVVYSLILGIALKQLNFKRLKEVMVDSCMTTTIVMLILGVAQVFSTILARAKFQETIINLLYSISDSKTVMLFMIMGFIFVLGWFVDVTAILIMFAGPLSKVGLALGYDPVHFGVVIVMIALIGAVTPPVGTLLFMGCSIAQIPIERILGILWPYVLTLLLITIITALFPGIVLFIPGMFY